MCCVSCIIAIVIVIMIDMSRRDCHHVPWQHSITLCYVLCWHEASVRELVHAQRQSCEWFDQYLASEDASQLATFEPVRLLFSCSSSPSLSPSPSPSLSLSHPWLLSSLTLATHRDWKASQLKNIFPDLPLHLRHAVFPIFHGFEVALAVHWSVGGAEEQEPHRTGCHLLSARVPPRHMSFNPDQPYHLPRSLLDLRILTEKRQRSFYNHVIKEKWRWVASILQSVSWLSTIHPDDPIDRAGTS